jgi:predicted TIM-barrel fold metal-dependent hydrolase
MEHYVCQECYDPNLNKMLELLTKGNFWVILSLGEKTSRKGCPWDEVIPIARAYIESAPDRCVWASDWPHPVSVVQPRNMPSCWSCPIEKEQLTCAPASTL